MISFIRFHRRPLKCLLAVSVILYRQTMSLPRCNAGCVVSMTLADLAIPAGGHGSDMQGPSCRQWVAASTSRAKNRSCPMAYMSEAASSSTAQLASCDKRMHSVSAPLTRIPLGVFGAGSQLHLALLLLQGAPAFRPSHTSHTRYSRASWKPCTGQHPVGGWACLKAQQVCQLVRVVRAFTARQACPNVR